MPTRELALPELGRVTAGIPSLSPEKRHDITEKALLSLYHRACVQESVDNESKTKAADGGMDVRNAEQRAGRLIPGWKFAIEMQKMAAANGRFLFVEPSKWVPNTVGLYSLDSNREKFIAASFPMEIVTEFFVCITDDAGMTKGHLPGWRTVGMKLIRQGFIRESQFHQKYGAPSHSSERWQKAVL